MKIDKYIVLTVVLLLIGLAILLCPVNYFALYHRSVGATFIYAAIVCLILELVERAELKDK